MSKLDKFCKVKGVTCEAKLLRRPINWEARGDDWKDSAFHWSVTLSYQGRRHVTEYWTGCGNVENQRDSLCPGLSATTKARTLWEEQRVTWLRNSAKPIPPSPADVLHSLMLDATAIEQGFEDWCADLGYDTDSRKAFETYLACQESGKLAQYLLRGEYEKFRNKEH